MGPGRAEDRSHAVHVWDRGPSQAAPGVFPLTGTGAPEAPAGVAEASRAWRFDPWRESRGRAMAALAAAVGCCALVVSLRPGLLPALGLCVFAAAAFAPAFVPVACRVDGEGVAVRGPLGWKRRAWRDLRRLDVLPAAALLSPYARRHPLDAQRAIVLPLPAGDREELLALLRRGVSAHGA